MLRRLLSATLLTAAVAAVPGAASAAPADPPVTAGRSTSYAASATLPLGDGRTADVYLGQFRASATDDWSSYLSVYVRSECTGFACGSGMATGYADLGGEAVIDERLAGASVSDVPLTLSSWSSGPDGFHTTEQQVTVSLAFTGTGAVARDVYHGEQCGDGSSPCLNSLRRDASRTADVGLELGDVTATGAGTISRGSSVDVYRTPTGG
ncbi:hypothetical protein [Geodermatophilus sp. SYSU D01119]